MRTEARVRAAQRHLQRGTVLARQNCADDFALMRGGPLFERLRSLAFNGKVKGVQISIAEDDGKHVVDPTEAIRMALARQ